MLTSELGNTLEGTALKLCGDLTIENAGELKALLMRLNEAPGDLSLDLSEIGAIDTAGLQMLCSAHKSWLVSGKSVTYKGDALDALAAVAKEAGYERKEACTTLAKGQCLWTGGSHE
jgi:ABC-type transporter Mla MlaB component